jgi:hypothetical protein
MTEREVEAALARPAGAVSQAGNVQVWSDEGAMIFVTFRAGRVAERVTVDRRGGPFRQLARRLGFRF